MNSKCLGPGMVLSTLFAVALLTGCSSNKEPAVSDGAKAEKREPVTVTMYNLGGITEEVFNEKFKTPVEKINPHITLKLIPKEKGTNSLDELALANSLPDAIFGNVTSKQYLEFMMDLDPLIKSTKFDIKRIEPALWGAYEYKTNIPGKIYALPDQSNMHLLYYNKDIFNKFGVSYPKNGMTWDETYELAKKVTRTDNGTKYMGFNFRADLNFSQSQLSLPYYDSATGKASVQTDQWKLYLTNFTRFYTITGNEITRTGAQLGNDNLFVKDQRVAMYAAHPMFTALTNAAKDTGMQWDMVSMPYFPEAPKQGTQPNTNGLSILQTSKHKEDAFIAIQTLLSDEVQLANNRLGWNTVLANEKIKAEFGKDLPGIADKNISAVNYNKYASSPKANEYNSEIASFPRLSFTKLVYGEVSDVNTALREAEEEMNKKIEEIKLTAAKK